MGKSKRKRPRNRTAAPAVTPAVQAPPVMPMGPVLQDTKNKWPLILPGLAPGMAAVDTGLEIKGKIKAQPSSFNMSGGRCAEMIRDYNRHLVEDLGMMSRRDLRKKDIIDLRAILDRSGLEAWQAPNPKLDMPEKLYTVDDYYYCYVPCFEEGVYQVNDHRYIYWKMTDLDLSAHRMMLWLQDFIYYDGDGSGWQPGVYGNVAWRFGDPEAEMDRVLAEKRRLKCEYAATGDAVTDYVKLYRLLDISKIGWGPDKQFDWEEWVVYHAEQTCGAMLAQTGQNNLDCLAAMFTTYTIKVNKILQDHKAAKGSRPASDAEHKAFTEARKAAKAAGEKPPKERRVRTIGPISVTSRAIPKPGRRAAANYTKASWETRAHFRTLKSGKKIYVKKSTHRRKALLTAENAGTAPEATPVTVKIMPQEKQKEDDTQ